MGFKGLNGYFDKLSSLSHFFDYVFTYISFLHFWGLFDCQKTQT